LAAVRNKSFLLSLIRTITLSSSLASSGGQGKYVKYFSFFWPQLEAALSNFNFIFFVKNNFLDGINEEKRRLSTISKHKLAKNVNLAKNCSVV